MSVIIGTETLLKLLKKTPQLNSLAIWGNEVALLFNDKELSNYLNQMIKRLSIYRARYHRNNNSTDSMEQFCKTFVNIEYLLYETNHEKELVFLLSHLPKLSTLHIKWNSRGDCNKYLFHFKNEVRKLNLIADINTESRNYWEFTLAVDLRMWLGKNTSELLTDFMNVMNSLVEH
jgi:hypothetical protein